MNFFLFFWAIFALLGPDSDPDCKSEYGSRDPIESRSTTLLEGMVAPLHPLEGAGGGGRTAIFIYSSVVYGTSFVDHELGCGGVLADAGAAHITGVGEPSVQDDELVDALVELLDLDAVVLGEDLAGHLPLGGGLVVAHLALEDDLVLLLAGLALQLLQAVTVLAKIKVEFFIFTKMLFKLFSCSTVGGNQHFWCKH